MNVICPKHKKLLKVNTSELNAAGIKIPVVIGTCPDCENIYYYAEKVSQSFYRDGIKFEYLSELSRFQLQTKTKTEKSTEVKHSKKSKNNNRTKANKNSQKGIPRCASYVPEKQKLDEANKLIERFRENPHSFFEAENCELRVDNSRNCPNDNFPLAKLHIRYKGYPVIGTRWCCLYCKSWFGTAKDLKEVKNIGTYSRQPLEPIKRSGNIEHKITLAKINHEQEPEKNKPKPKPKHNFCDLEKPKTVYVFSHKGVFHKNAENYETVTAKVPCAGTVKPVTLTVYYEKTTGKYFINADSYEKARLKYGLPYLRIKAESSGIYGTDFGGLKENSELKMLGYSVGASSGMSLKERQKLLGEIVDSGVLTKAEILSHIDWLIKSRKHMKNMQNAVDEWKTDRAFVSKYKLNRQRLIWVNAFATKSSGEKKVK